MKTKHGAATHAQLRTLPGALFACVLLLCAASAAIARPAAILREGSVELKMSIQKEKGAKVYRRTILSPTHKIDTIYKSMEGPASIHLFSLRNLKRPELLWLMSYNATMVAADGETTMSQEYMCHSNLNTPPDAYARRFPSAFAREEVRLFTLAQGQLHIDLPDGFGIPIMSDQTLNLQSQVLNANFGFSSFETRHKISIEFLRDAEIAKPMIPLFPIPAYGMKLVEGEAGYFGVPEEEVDPEVHGVGCLPGVALPGSARLDSQGRVFTGHWEVAPGLEENHTLVTEKMDLPFDTTIHYIAAHLHPYAESLELYDLTARKTVYKTRARNTPDRIGLEEVEYFASVEGLPVYKDHQYEIVSMYNNTTDEPQTAMAGFFLYLRAKDLEKAINESRASQRASGSELTAAPQE